MLKATLLMLLVFAELALGDDAAIVHERSAAPSGARYEIVQSPILAKLTFKLDRVTGKTWQIVESKSDGLRWEVLPITGLAQVSPTSAPRFQIFESALAARFTFLVDTLSGSAWIFTNGGPGHEDDRSWQPMGGAPSMSPTVNRAAPPTTKPTAGEPLEPNLNDFATYGEYETAQRAYIRDLVKYEAKLAVVAREAVIRNAKAAAKK